ncbi:MAG: 3-oxoacyl-ACP synthase, partial [Flavobacteriaceae bacterium]|nr:3-oxoacyl-ACP synthase [Flavobacteriaceae bacterium]
MNKKYYIQKTIRIRAGEIRLDESVVLKGKDSTFKSFMKEAYHAFDLNYSKFFKMDELSKLAFLSADILLTSDPESLSWDENMALVFSNRASSLTTDRKHQQSIADPEAHFPSPAVFVYTLPNICMGEISIKHSLYSENSFFIFDSFNAKHLFSYTKVLMDQGKASSVLCGWVNVDAENYESILFLVGTDGETPFSIQELNRLYTE